MWGEVPLIKEGGPCTGVLNEALHLKEPLLTQRMGSIPPPSDGEVLFYLRYKRPASSP